MSNIQLHTSFEWIEKPEKHFEEELTADMISEWGENLLSQIGITIGIYNLKVINTAKLHISIPLSLNQFRRDGFSFRSRVPGKYGPLPLYLHISSYLSRTEFLEVYRRMKILAHQLRNGNQQGIMQQNQAA